VTEPRRARSIFEECVKPRPHAGVIRWLAEADEECIFISVISIAEISRGLEKMPKSKRRDRIAAWLVEDLPKRFERRILPVDFATAQDWGVVSEEVRKRGVSLTAMDAFFAATARIHEMTLVTRNTRDFQHLRAPLLNPWE
jgi:toxin FitB